MRTLFTACLSVVFLASCGNDALPPEMQKLSTQYYSTLDEWVEEGGDFNAAQETVIGTCGKLVMLHASEGERAAFIKAEREEFDFRVDVCANMTVNRIHPQPEFEKPAIVRSICVESSNQLFHELCKRSGLG